MSKKKGLLVIAATLIALAVTAGIFILPKGVILVPQYLKEYFGDKTAELYTFQTPSEAKIGRDIASEVLTVMQYTGDEDSAPEAGALSRYYWFPYLQQPDSADADVILCKADIHGDEGSVWIMYTLSRYDESGKCIEGSSGILVRCTVSRDSDGSWEVTGTNEHP